MRAFYLVKVTYRTSRFVLSELGATANADLRMLSRWHSRCLGSTSHSKLSEMIYLQAST